MSLSANSISLSSVSPMADEAGEEAGEEAFSISSVVATVPDNLALSTTRGNPALLSVSVRKSFSCLSFGVDDCSAVDVNPMKSFTPTESVTSTESVTPTESVALRNEIQRERL